MHKIGIDKGNNILGWANENVCVEFEGAVKTLIADMTGKSIDRIKYDGKTIVDKSAEEIAAQEEVAATEKAITELMELKMRVAAKEALSMDTTAEAEKMEGIINGMV